MSFGRLSIIVATMTLLMTAHAGMAADRQIDVCFNPGQDCTGKVVEAIGTARRTILVQAYSFTSPPIAQALVQAKKRGVDVRAVLDKSQRTEKYSGADFLVNGGVPVQIDASHAIAHNKVMVLDGGTVITGSFNFTKAAQERNAENLLVIHDPELAAQYESNWRKHAGHSERYEGRGR
ncbi:phospholipase D family protein [Magnetospirillum moscoviense]|uniref:Phospholipase D n=1 Tax=Magnetospirillum moscoviense TaxID=1437059 RepID=A0A178M8Y8_9PROT|nr:phospholipase D family protein [Magnetospirillum moscoviense]OAN44498.1 phospholipase [Magnetospirillum moscoviense]